MIDVDSKPLTKRTAIAEGFVRMKPETLKAILSNRIKKGNVICVSQTAGIMGAKYTPTLIPMCHPIPLSNVKVEITPDGNDGLRVEVSTVATWKTGVEMEALSAVTVTCLNIYDMCKSIDRGMKIENVRLLYKSGGKSGEYRAL
jgi:cyclic pyranopterin phosphate synthase